MTTMEPAVFDKTLRGALSCWELPVTPTQMRQFHGHYLAVIEANQTMNLTRIVEPAAAAVKHYADSLALCLWARVLRHPIETVLDIGTGAGYPAIPLAIARPDWEVTAIEATRKKADFVKRISVLIGLNNVRVEHAHSRHWKPGRTYQVLTLRAVTQVPRALQQVSRHLAPGGWIVCYRTASASQAENTDAGTLSLPASLRLDSVYCYDLQIGGETVRRALQVFGARPPD